MRRCEHSLSGLPVYALAILAALAMVLLPGPAISGSYDTGRVQPKVPRWSNDHHLSDAVTVGPDCVTLAPGQAADYIPGRDAWGNPVPPADSHTGYVNSLPVEVEVHLGTKKIGKRRVDLSTGPMIYDPGQNTLNGYPLARDCAPYFK